jgi:hypothetical protein
MELFDLLTKLQSARLHEPGTIQSDLIRGQIRGLRQSLLAGQTAPAAKPETSDVSRELALLWLQSIDDHGPSS